ncbi:MAG TPA: ABC transporter substrate-binding protein, partial [Mycobacteriales bacterium]|nr:ABC transporter substrate-binding protein [Mycobacteriales bacterium]
MTRRSLLYGSALVAASAGLSACSGGGGSASGSGGAIAKGKGSARKPLSAPAHFSESPALAKQVKSGALPPVEKRLPKQPYVLPHNWVGRGNYGGRIYTSMFSSQGAAKADSLRFFFYGHSPLRWLNDGLDIGPGHVQSWSSNSDASEWTFRLRDGIKWSDGHPFTTEDILFWWEDIALPGNFAQVPADGFRSGTGTLCTMTAVDDRTLRLTYDTPVTLAAEWLALWPKGGVGTSGDIWVLPKHYCKQFHPKYNPSVPKDWDSVGGLWERKTDWMRNPECPTLLGYMCKSFDNNKGIVLERNPYYWCVTKDGDQLPYIDEITVDIVQSPEVAKLQVQQGKIDYCHGPAVQIDLADVSTLQKSKDQAGTEIRLWDSGSGTGSMFFLNYDYPDEKYRTLFRDVRFRRALSYAFDRAAVHKSLYYQTGELTTGTVGPKCTEFHVGDGKGIYARWRDSYIKHDIGKAKQLLADLGLKDSDNDGYLEFPDGRKLTIYIDYSADIST